MKRFLPILLALMITVPVPAEEIAGFLGADYYLLVEGTERGNVYANGWGRTFNPDTQELGFYSGLDQQGNAIINLDPFTLEDVLGAGFSLLTYTPEKGNAYVGLNGTAYYPATNEVGSFLGRDALGRPVVEVIGELEGVNTWTYSRRVIPLGGEGAAPETDTQNQTSDSGVVDITPQNSPAPTAPPASSAPGAPYAEPTMTKDGDEDVYTGSGDSFFPMESFSGYYFFEITGNQESSHFSVTAYDAEGTYLDLMVNVTEPYNGRVYVDGKPSRLEVKARGEWTIRVKPITKATITKKGRSVSGKTDDVFLFSGEAPESATVTGNSLGHHFSITSYNSYGKYLDLLVNTTDPYSGRVRIENGSKLYQVKASDKWIVSFEE